MTLLKLLKEKNLWLPQNQELKESFVKDGAPRLLNVWGIILKYGVLLKSYEDFVYFPPKKQLMAYLAVCQTFNQLPELREFFHKIAMLNNGPRIYFSKSNPQYWCMDHLKFYTLMTVKCRKNGQKSNKIFGITWISANTNTRFDFKWSRLYSIWFFTKVSQIMTLDGKLLPNLTIPNFNYQRSLTNTDYIFRKLRKVRWTKELIKNDTDKIDTIVGKYHLLVLASPFNLYGSDVNNHIKTIKREPIAKISCLGSKMCYLVYKIRSNWRYRIIMKSDHIAQYSIYFKTNIL